MTTIYARDVQVNLCFSDADSNLIAIVDMPIGEAAEIADGGDLLREWEDEYGHMAGSVAFIELGGYSELPRIMKPESVAQLVALAEVCEDLDAYGVSLEVYATYMDEFGYDRGDYPEVGRVSDAVRYVGWELQEFYEELFWQRKRNVVPRNISDYIDFEGWFDSEARDAFTIAELDGYAIRHYVVFWAHM